MAQHVGSMALTVLRVRVTEILFTWGVRKERGSHAPWPSFIHWAGNNPVASEGKQPCKAYVQPGPGGWMESLGSSLLGLCTQKQSPFGEKNYFLNISMPHLLKSYLFKVLML